jgi:subtilisin family serine protease
MFNTLTETQPLTATGRGVRVAIVDSGVHATHPHVQGVAGGVGITADGACSDDFLDRIGHGTAVTAAIREKAPDADLYAVRVFDRALSANVATLCAALDWAIDAGMRVINLSLGTANPVHRNRLAAVVQRATDRGAIIVAAGFDEGIAWLPGSLPGVVPVHVDWRIPREEFQIVWTPEGEVMRTSGFPRPIPGVPPERNLNGISFAVANATGFVARILEHMPSATAADILAMRISDT